jgi:hypothetical protein
MPMQCASRVILIRPTGFGYDPQTAESNDFQRHILDNEVRYFAEEEFDAVLGALDTCGIGTLVLDPHDISAPNAVFPNNWFSTHEDGTVVLYPMCTPSRRKERDRDLDETLLREGFRVSKLIDLSSLELDARYLEGTGSLVIDHKRSVAFAALSPRTTERALNHWCGQLNGHQVPFLATMDGTLLGRPVYHTNVVMSIGEKFAVVCLEAMPYPVDRDDVWTELDRSGKEIIPISLEQMHRYVANMLELRVGDTSFIFLSTTAFEALKPAQRIALERYAQLVPISIPTIETVGGGSVRCMIAENFLSPI